MCAYKIEMNNKDALMAESVGSEILNDESQFENTVDELIQEILWTFAGHMAELQ